MKITHQLTNVVLFEDDATTTIKETLEGAVKARANLAGANLAGAYLGDAYLAGANLAGANLSHADLSYAYLTRANLDHANLTGACLRWANLDHANLTGACLMWANLSHADLSYAYLTRANLAGANLAGANLEDADLTRANLDHANLAGALNYQLPLARTRILPEGTLIGWKKCEGGKLVKLRIPEDSPRSHAFGRKCRAKFVDVIEVVGSGHAVSARDGKTTYRTGERVECDKWCDDWAQECAGGIHFFITREEAEAYE